MASDRRQPRDAGGPTVAEAGLENFSAEAWLSLMSTAGTPAPVVERLTRECAEILRSDALKERVIRAGAFARYEDPAMLAGRIDRELVNWTRLVREQRLSTE